MAADPSPLPWLWGLDLNSGFWVMRGSSGAAATKPNQWKPMTAYPYRVVALDRLGLLGTPVTTERS
jgi:hypothetical protein